MDTKVTPYIHKVHYYETDKMGITHHSNYIRWMEEARVDFFEKIGFGYDRLEAEGVGSPVVAVECKYKAVTKFPEEISVEVKIKEFKGVKMIVGYEMHRVSDGTLVFFGTSEHCFTDENGKLVMLKKTHPKFAELLTTLVEKDKE